MNGELETLLRGNGGVVERSVAEQVVSSSAISYALRTGRVIAAFPRVLLLTDAIHPATRARAALLSVGPDAALSHLTALFVWGVAPHHGERIHVTTAPDRRIRIRGVVAHHRAGFRAEPPQVVVRQELPITGLDQTLIDCWPLLPGPDRRAAIIAAAAERQTTPQRLRAIVNATERLAGRASLYVLLDRLEAGCRSELELWGYDKIFTGSGMPEFHRQYPVRIHNRTAYLDVYAEPERTNFELDGDAYHRGKVRREQDLRRDSALAALGIVVVRFTHDRLTTEPDAVRHDVLRILAARRVQGPLPHLG
ncbi:MAG: DUF559 domain-containing protein [Sporichthyaceae bacterium]|nr:DUF559 domain-containing protein [Sporichthyaceae bacterium]